MIKADLYGIDKSFSSCELVHFRQLYLQRDRRRLPFCSAQFYCKRYSLGSVLELGHKRVGIGLYCTTWCKYWCHSYSHFEDVEVNYHLVLILPPYSLQNLWNRILHNFCLILFTYKLLKGCNNTNNSRHLTAFQFPISETKNNSVFFSVMVKPLATYLVLKLLGFSASWFFSVT